MRSYVGAVRGCGSGCRVAGRRATLVGRKYAVASGVAGIRSETGTCRTPRTSRVHSTHSTSGPGSRKAHYCDRRPRGSVEPRAGVPPRAVQARHRAILSTSCRSPHPLDCPEELQCRDQPGGRSGRGVHRRCSRTPNSASGGHGRAGIRKLFGGIEPTVHHFETFYRLAPRG